MQFISYIVVFTNIFVNIYFLSYLIPTQKRADRRDTYLLNKFFMRHTSV